MARGGINKAVVQTARLAILARGENPSIDAVRIEMGNTGSKTTIHRYLKELDESDLEPSNGGERWHKDEVKAAMEGEDSVSAARNAMESSMAGEGKEVPADDTASFNDTLEAEAAAPANEEAAFTETDIETEAGLVDDPDA